ncbi:MAG: NAD(+) diphosphatase [Steroidobacteraceae bacterium]
MTTENLFAGGYLDRRAEARLKADWFEEARADGQALYVVMRGSAVLMRGTDRQPALALLSATDARVRALADPDHVLLLGWFRERRCLLLELPEDLPPSISQEESFAELRPLAGQLPPQEAGLLAYARALSIWRANHRFCSRCGHALRSERAGHARVCAACGYHSFPRIDPAIIVLVHHDGQVLLGRQASWAANRYSTIAGFVEPGESLEDAVRREVAEETGIAVDTIRYQSSQPWPFPASLMLGFRAHGTWATPQLHDAELEDARWLTREQIRAGAVQLPPPESISRRLIDAWLDEES